MRKWYRVFNAARVLIRTVGRATEDDTLSKEEMSQIMKAMWAVIRAYRGQ